MSRIVELFQQKKTRILNVYFTAGYPRLESTIPIMEAVQESGVDLIELGMPYSDPLADGPVIQQSSQIALANGMTIQHLFDQLTHFREKIQVPVVLMGYMNPVLQYGFERFCKQAAAIGIDGLILPDLPDFEYQNTYGDLIKQNGLNFVFLVTPETTEERIRKLDNLSSGFLYAVSSSATTGKENDYEKVNAYLRRLQAMKLKNPILVGFGIKDKASFQQVCQHANGAIIGSSFISMLSKTKLIKEGIHQFIQNILQ